MSIISPFTDDPTVRGHPQTVSFTLKCGHTRVANGDPRVVHGWSEGGQGGPCTPPACPAAVHVPDRPCTPPVGTPWTDPSRLRTPRMAAGTPLFHA